MLSQNVVLFCQKETTDKKNASYAVLKGHFRITEEGTTLLDGSPYLQHRVATLLVQHGRRHQNHPTRNPFLNSCRFRLCSVQVQAAVVNLIIFRGPLGNDF